MGATGTSTPAPHRLSRAAVLAAVMAVAGTLAHVTAGGSVSPPALLVGLALLVGPAWLLTGRERGWTAIAGAQLAGQQIVHAALELAGSGHDSHGAVPTDLMTYGHLTVAALLATGLRLGERRMWRTARRVALAITARLRTLLALFEQAPVPAPAAPPAPPAPPVRPGRNLHHVVVRRGPPLPV